MVQFYEITTAIHQEFRDMLAIYTESFPANERHTGRVIRKRVNNGQYRAVVGRLPDEVVFMALLWPLKNTDFILLDYMAVKKGYRGEGIGTEFMRHIFDILKMYGKYLILEVENPDYGNNTDQRKRRVAFYSRNGAVKMESVRYILPPLSGVDPTEMIMMILPEYNEGQISGKVVKELIIQIYREVYNRNEEDLLLNSFIHDIPSSVSLLRSD